MSSTVTHVTDTTFPTEVEQSPQLTIAYFWATWCGPCRPLAPILEQVAADHAGAVKITKVNADENIGTAARFNIRSVPTLLFFKGGEVVARIVGLVPKTRIEATLAQYS